MLNDFRDLHQSRYNESMHSGVEFLFKKGMSTYELSLVTYLVPIAIPNLCI